ncbi:PREDICTED: golgin subfamily A member 6-like protein 1 [Cyprinodon variegatus]|uniref:golgin subfamily A member 6-like protein 1 n=1 Tax=Cyprinodon variegatus TaxID=28743 RepID=UPI000742978B|nr:PREDICTED: golgin subfamily A member 6-like protein 1 [Cyprinodon variegatus]XP_015229699.1 PREDICTED: golgin subfamily A member 6-like protein 1 [Cyprinodon variegatus]
MAAAQPDPPMKRRSSSEIFRPNLSEEGNGEKDEGLTMTLKPKASLNLVLFGRRGPVKTSAAKAILGQIDLPSASNSSECVRNQGEVHGRLVSVVELPAFYGKAQQEVMEESFRCISLCDPEGVHAFILVLPVGPLTDEDKGELQTIQDTFSSRVNDFTIILFTVESDPTDPDFIETDRNIQELLQGCGGRYVVLNIKDSQQIPELMETVEMMINEQLRSFSKDVFTRILIERTLKLKAELQDVEPKSEEEGEDEPQSIEPRRKETDVKEKDEEDKKKHRDEVKALQAKLEQERKQKIQLLKEKEELMESERIKTEREEAERKWRRTEESQWKEWQQKFGALQKQVSFEREQKEAAEKRLEQCRRERVREREAFEKEKDKIWERMHEELKQNLQEERMSHRKLLEEYYRKRRKWTYVWFASLVLFLVLLYLYQSR